MATCFGSGPNPIRTDADCAGGFKKTSTVEFHHESPTFLVFYFLNPTKSHYAYKQVSFAQEASRLG
jgi:hypothetical protein